VQFLWGFVDQALASITSFLLTLVVARQAGAEGVGALALAWAAFLIVLGAQRALLIEPYLTRSSSTSVTDMVALGGSVSLSIMLGLAAALAFGAVGRVDSGAIGAGFRTFAPWIAPLLVQHLLRAAKFRSGCGAVAACGSAVYLAAFGICLGAGLNGTLGRIVAAWGVGAVVSIAWLLAFRSRPKIVGVLAAIRWWKSEAMHFGGSLIIGVVLASTFSYALLGGLAAIAGTAAVGGYRVIESVFSPLSLLGPALENPGSRAIRNAWTRQPDAAFALGVKISSLAVFCMVVYALVVGFAQSFVFRLYGEGFAAYADLIAPIAIAQTVIAAAIGFGTVLRVARRGRDAVMLGTGGAFLALVIGLSLAATVGFTAAVWGIALAYIPPLVWGVAAARAATRHAALELNTVASPVEAGSAQSA